MERLKRLRKELGDRILQEEERKDSRDSKRKESKKSTTSEGSFKQPGHHTPPRGNRGGNSGTSSGGRS
jgi:hypothetical protein